MAQRTLFGLWLKGSTLNNVGFVAYHRQEIERAASLFRKGLSILREEGDMRAIIESLFAMAGVALSQGEAHRAVRLLGSAAASWM